jgi:DNA invertase Pin-like site-specific DNA recombinase
MKKYIALARVSSREQEREGFSLEVQEAAFQNYATKHDGKIEYMFRIVETATRSEQRKVFKALLKFAKKHASTLDAILFYKVDRAVRNLFDYVELERLESEEKLPFISISQPTENTPAGRMMRRTLANMAAFYTEQQSLDVREGIKRRVECGLPPNRAAFGYRNVRRDGRSIVEVHPENGPKVRRIFELYAFHGLPIDALSKRLREENTTYSASRPHFSPSKLYAILTDRSYLGEVKHRGEWHPGQQTPLIDRETWDRVQVLLGQKVYRSHDMVYAGGLITCGHCGHPISGETKEKQTKSGPRQYIYYRCARYHHEDHPRIRLKEHDLDDQILAQFHQMHSVIPAVRSWLILTLQKKIEEAHRTSTMKLSELRRLHSLVQGQQNELLNLRLAGKISDEQFVAKQCELREREQEYQDQMQAFECQQRQATVLAQRAPQIVQIIREKWEVMSRPTKRRIMEIIFTNMVLAGDQLVTGKRTPFELLAAG